jgi:putative membrane protein
MTSPLPALNAILNGTAFVLLVSGYLLIRRGNRNAHRAAMIAAVATSGLFLTSYVAYHASAGSRPFTGEGAFRAFYFAILLTHVVLAAAIVPMVLLTLWRAAAGRYPQHRRVARWTLPLWLYVSITGVAIYVMLYRMGP